MARLTTAQLLSQLEAANAAYEHLATECASLRAECEALRRLGPTARRVQSVAPATPELRRAAMAAAKAEAARTGKCVRAW